MLRFSYVAFSCTGIFTIYLHRVLCDKIDNVRSHYELLLTVMCLENINIVYSYTAIFGLAILLVLPALSSTNKIHRFPQTILIVVYGFLIPFY